MKNSNAVSNFLDLSNGFPDHKLSRDLRKLALEIFDIAFDYGLTHFPIKFQAVSPQELNGIAAYEGFPIRIPHWIYGMSFNDLHKRYTYGQSKIYELVINSNPVIAYLVKTNTRVEQKLVMIHVCAHADFFYNNKWFGPTDRGMLDQMANNSSRVKNYAKRKGDIRVEEFLDVCYSLSNLIDPYLEHIKRKYEYEDEEEEITLPIYKLKSKEYMDRYINNQEFIEHQKNKIREEKIKRKKFPIEQDRDVLGFLIEHAPKLEKWQRNILAMVREESYYFAPQMFTKVMNEGWAVFWHSQAMTTGLAGHDEIIDYCDSQARAIAPRQTGINPYRLGFQLFKDIEDRWNKGRFGLEWERCDDLVKKTNWDKKLGNFEK